MNKILMDKTGKIVGWINGHGVSTSPIVVDVDAVASSHS